MAKYGLDLQRKNKKRKTTALIIGFLCFAIVLGSVSTLLLWRSLNYDFENIFNKNQESTTEVVTTVPAEKVAYEGSALFLVAVTSDDGKEVDFMNFISVDLKDRIIRVIPIDISLQNAEGKTPADVLLSNGIKAAVEHLEKQNNTQIGKYLVFTESGYKSVFRVLGDITLTVNEQVEYDTPDMFLELNRGSNTLTPEKTYKYMKYLCETQSPEQCSKLNAQIIVAAFNAFFNSKKFDYDSNDLFSKLINYCDTDISIVDYTEAKDKIQYLLPQSAKEKLKVFVSAKENSDDN